MHSDIIFTDLGKELAAKAAEIAEKHVRPGAAKYDKLQEYNWDAAKAVAEAGLFGTFIPKEYGGTGAGILPLAMVTEPRLKWRGREELQGKPGERVRLVLSHIGSRRHLPVVELRRTA